jgi:carbamoyl-phosphate synthase large subunit
MGGAPGFDLARAITRLGGEVIAVDADPLAAGFRLGSTGRVIPIADAPDFGSGLLRVCDELRPEALISTVEAELPHLLDLRDELDDRAIRTWLPHRHAVEACADKAVFHSVLRRHDIPTPHTWLPDQLAEVPARCELVVKARRGYGSKNLYFCQSRRQAEVLCELVPQPLIQQRVTGAEFTADCLVDRDGQASVVLRERLRIRNGLAMVATTFHDEQVAGLVAATLAAVGVEGLCCVQGFIRDAAAGPRVVITEVNARVAGAFALSGAAGADLITQTLNGLGGLPVDHTRLTYRAGVTHTKYVETFPAAPTTMSAPLQETR